MSETIATPQFDENKLSDRQRQVLSVLRAGKGNELDELMSRLSVRAQGNYAAVDNDDTRTEEWKKERIDQLHTSTIDTLDTELAKLARSHSDTHRKDFGAVFGTDGVAGDAASLAISRRDAGDRVASVNATGDLLDLLERADLSGDEVLARAVAERAYQQGNATVLERFLETRPALQEQAKRLWQRRDDRDWVVDQLWNFSMKFGGLKPARR